MHVYICNDNNFLKRLEYEMEQMKVQGKLEKAKGMREMLQI